MSRSKNASPIATSTSIRRCRQVARSGRPCRYLSHSPDSSYCRRHAHLQRRDDDLLAAELSSAAGDLSSPNDVLRVLSKTFLAFTQNRVTPRKAAVLGYLGQMLLRAHREISHHKELDRKNNPLDHFVEFIDLPRPERDGPDDPPPPTAGRDSSSQCASASPDASAAQPSKTAAAGTPANAQTSGGRDFSRDVPPSAPQPSKTAGVATALDASSSANGNATTSSKKQAFSEPEPKPAPPFDPRHFYHFDPTLPQGLQDPMNTVPPHLRRYARYSKIYTGARR